VRSATIGENWDRFEAMLEEVGADEHNITALRQAFSFGVAISLSRYCSLLAAAVLSGADQRFSVVDLLQDEYDQFCSGERRTLQ
jgi:hypothetical protein